ncbi:MAG: protein GrpE [Chloroflexota bacterium]
MTDQTTEPAAADSLPTIDLGGNAAPEGGADDLEALRAALDEARAREARALADYQNLLRRAREERAEIGRIAVADAVAGLLPVLDDLERAVDSAPEDVRDHAFAEGVRLVLQGFRRALEQRGVEEIHALHQPFDPNKHEAVGQAPGPENQVVHLVRRGYAVNDRVIRPAMVMVGSGEGATT